MGFELHIDFVSRAFQQTRPAKRSRVGGQAGGRKGSKLTSRQTHRWAGRSHSAQRTRQSQSLIYHASISVGPRDPSQLFLCSPLHPQPGPDKDLFTWQSAVEDQGREKKEGSFQSPMGSKSSAWEVMVTWFLFKTERLWELWIPWCWCTSSYLHQTNRSVPQIYSFEKQFIQSYLSIYLGSSQLQSNNHCCQLVSL